MMPKTLYQKLKLTEDYEEVIEDTIELLTDMDEIGYLSSSRSVQQKLFKKYMRNPILDDALQGRQTISESLEEIAKKDRFSKFFIPRRKNKAYNERINQIDELINAPQHLRTRGILFPDNFVNSTIVYAPFLGGSMYLITGHSEISLASATVAPIIGLMNAFAMNTSPLISTSQKQAKYLDNKIKELYFSE